VIIAVLFLVGGVVAGLVWQWWWDAPSGIVLDGQFRLDEQGLPQEFSGTGRFVLVALVTGLVLGAVVALLLPRGGFVALAATLVAAAVSGWVMAFVGHALGPADPDVLAQGEPDLTALVSDLRVVGWAPYLVLPIGAVTGLAVVMLAQAATGRFRLGGDLPPSKVAA
jgi:hypothetical protein